jgi:Fe-S-cluster containining protein
MNYQKFLSDFDKKLKGYCEAHREFIHCKSGCSFCCEKGDYPISRIELEYLMKGFISLDNETKIKVQNNIKNIVKGGECPFLINKKCSVYFYRPIICRVHGLAYICKDNVVKVPYCVNDGKNYAEVYKNGEITINPVLENLDTQNVLKDFEFGEIRNLVDWLERY